MDQDRQRILDWTRRMRKVAENFDKLRSIDSQKRAKLARRIERQEEIKKMVDRLRRWDANKSKTNKQKLEMMKLVRQISAKVPELDLAYDPETDELTPAAMTLKQRLAACFEELKEG